jgi:hypothetical protein
MKHWTKKERDDEKAFEGRRTKGSGNQWHSKGDVKAKRFLIEDKSTEHKSFTVTKKLWEKIWGEAIINGRIPILSLRIDCKDPLDLVVLDQRDFLELTGEKHDNNTKSDSIRV